MVGGDAGAVAVAQPIFDSLKPPTGGFVHAGPVGAGHFIKMVHNGIEYGIMQAYGEGYELMKAVDLVPDPDKVMASWQNGTVIRSWLLDLLVRALDSDPSLACSPLPTTCHCQGDAMARLIARIAAFVALAVVASTASAAFHMFRLSAIYSNADGSVQFVVLRECCGSDGESLWNGVSLRSGAQTLVFPRNLPSGDTAGKSVLVATQGFADLGLIAPDYIMPANFLSIGGGSLNYAGVSQMTYGAMPTDGRMLLAAGTAVPNRPPISRDRPRAWAPHPRPPRPSSSTTRGSTTTS